MHSFRRSYTPATIVLLVTNIVVFFLQGTEAGVSLIRFFGFSAQGWLSKPWTLVTWPLVGLYEPFSLLFTGLLFYWVCSSLERSWSTRVFVGFLAAMAAITAIGLAIGARIMGADTLLAGLLVASGPPAVAWSAINRFEKVNLYGVIPVPAPAIGIFMTVVVWFYGGGGSPLLGLFALGGCAAAYWYAMHGRYAYRGYSENRSPFDRFKKQQPGLRLVDLENDVRPNAPIFDRFNPMRWYRSWRTRREVEKLFKRSGTDPRDR
jgi:hypothetical protein